MHDDLTYEEESVKILDRKEKVLRTKTVPLVKVLWQYHDVREATWETEEKMRELYPKLFHAGMNFENEFFFKKGRM